MSPKYAIPIEEWIPLDKGATKNNEDKSILKIAFIGLLLGFLLKATINLMISKSLLIAFGAVILMLPVHELLHGIFYPNLKSTVFFIYWNPFATTEKEMSKKRFLFCLILPTIAIGIIPLTARFFLFDYQYHSILLQYSIIQIVSCCSDIYRFFIIQLKVPKNSKLKLHGSHIYYKQ